MFNFDNTYLSLGDDFYSKEVIRPTKNPEMIRFNDALADKLNITTTDTDIYVGNTTIDGAANVALAYAGHQFGHFTMLGDGRALLLGEHVVGDTRVDISLKGSGRTAFSKVGDGKLPLDAALREYLMSEAMYHLNIPTTRTLAVVKSPQKVIREEIKPAAVLTRVAKSHIRIGTFEYAVRSGDNHLKALADYTIARHFPDITGEKKYFEFIQAVIKEQAELVSKWQAVGFIHGVMNTDNISLAGETIDYGPCAFMDTYHPETVYSSIDTDGRYQFGNQPSIMQWNLTRFAETFIEMLTVEMDMEESDVLAELESILATFAEYYNSFWFFEMGKKIGLKEVRKEDTELIKGLLIAMIEAEVDYTSTFITLTEGHLDELDFLSEDWKAKYEERLKEEEDPHSIMVAVNPNVIPRNHIVEEALYNAVKHGDFTLFDELLVAVQDPYGRKHAPYLRMRPERHVERAHVTYCGT